MKVIVEVVSHFPVLLATWLTTSLAVGTFHEIVGRCEEHVCVTVQFIVNRLPGSITSGSADITGLSGDAAFKEKQGHHQALSCPCSIHL